MQKPKKINKNRKYIFFKNNNKDNTPVKQHLESSPNNRVRLLECIGLLVSCDMWEPLCKGST